VARRRVFRVLAQHLSEALKQPFVVEGPPGAGSIIGTDAVAKSPPDGYTLLAMSNTHTTNESLVPNKPFQLMRDFVPVAGINYSDLVMVVHPAVPAKNLAEFIAYAKSKPGELNYASSGAGTPYHMAGELFKAMTAPTSCMFPTGFRRGAQQRDRRPCADDFDAITTMASNVRGRAGACHWHLGAKRSSVCRMWPPSRRLACPATNPPSGWAIMGRRARRSRSSDKLNAEINKAIIAPT